MLRPKKELHVVKKPMCGVQFLLRHGANISAETEDGWQPLHSACKWNNARCVVKLLEHGADPNAASKGGK